MFRWQKRSLRGNIERHAGIWLGEGCQPIAIRSSSLRCPGALCGSLQVVGAGAWHRLHNAHYGSYLTELIA